MAASRVGPPDDGRPVSRSTLIGWLAAGILCVGAFSLFCVHAPPRLKLLGLFAVAHGVVSGWILAQLARSFGIRDRRRLTLAAFAVIFAAQIGMAAESHRVRVEQFRTQQASDPSSLTAALRIEQAPPPDDPEAFAQWRQMREPVREMTTFAAYLRHRFSALGPLEGPWPWLVWIAELVAAGIAGAALVHSQAGRTPHASALGR